MKVRHLIAGLAAVGAGAVAANAATIVVTSDITANTTWLNTNEYVLQGSTLNQGVIRVLPGVTLTIQGGTIVRGQPRTNAGTYNAGSLAVLRGAKIIANGSAGNPIIFTTAAVDADADGEPDNYVRNGLPGSGAAAAVVATRFDPANDDHWSGDTAGQGTPLWWDNAPKTSPRTNTATGLWGGVIVLGRAPVNYAASTDLSNFVETTNVSGAVESPYEYTKPFVEGLTSPDYAYGSDWSDGTSTGAAEPLPAGTPGSYVRKNFINPDDDSGSITYVSIRHGGIQLQADNEINGLTLGGVGRGTKIAFVEVWGNEDDGVEIFGGTVNLSNLVIVGTKDDGLDIDHGYTGQIQFVLVVGGSYADMLLEWDGDDATETGKGSMANWAPRAAWEVRNATLISSANDRGNVARIRNNASCRFYNSIVYNADSSDAFRSQIESNMYVEVRNVTVNGFAGTLPSTSGNKVVTNLSVASAGIAAPVFFGGDTLAGDVAAHGGQLLRPSVIDIIGSGIGYLIPLSLPSSSLSTSGNRGFFTDAPYRGAFDNSVAPWTTGWTAINAIGAL